MIPVNIIVAIDEKHGIGKDNALPWDLSGDLRRFRDITTATRSLKKKNVVVMGRKTWDSIPTQFRPLPGRTNIVLTRNKNLQLPEGVLKAASFDQVLQMSKSARLRNIIETIFVIGGQQVYEEAIKCPECQKLYITRIHGTFDCDSTFPPFEDEFESIQVSDDHKEGPVIYHFDEYKRKNTPNF